MSALEKTVQIGNKRGLHARAAAKFVKMVEQFNADVKVAKDDMEVGGSSIMGLLMLGAGVGCDVTIEGEGPDAAEAVAALADLVNRKFDEDQ